MKAIFWHHPRVTFSYLISIYFFSSRKDWTEMLMIECRLIIGYGNIRTHFVVLNSIFCCFIIQEGVSIWGTKIVTHLVVFRRHTPSLDYQKAWLVTDFELWCVVISAAAPMDAPFLPCDCQWGQESTEELFSKGPVWKSLIQSWKMWILVWEFLEYFGLLHSL
jgi:hypothetical protein